MPQQQHKEGTFDSIIVESLKTFKFIVFTSFFEVNRSKQTLVGNFLNPRESIVNIIIVFRMAAF